MSQLKPIQRPPIRPTRRSLQRVSTIVIPVAIVLLFAIPVNPQASESPAPDLPPQNVRVESGDGIPWELLIGVIVAAIGIVPQFLKSNTEKVQMQVSAEAERRKALEESNAQLFKNFQEQISSLNKGLDNYRLLEDQWRRREDELDARIDELNSVRRSLEGEIQVLKIENARYRSKLGIDPPTNPPRIVADVNIKQEGDRG